MKLRKAASTSGYAGFFKGRYLRSSLEFLYAVLLEKDKIEWEYETKVYELSSGERYKPDFYLPETDEIVEVKGDLRYEADLPKIKLFEIEYGVTVKIIRLHDLIAEYKARNLRYTRFQAKWKKHATRQGQDRSGELNPRYGMPQNQSTKDLIGQKARERWTDNEYRDSMTEAFKKRDLTNYNWDHLRGEKVERVIIICDNCKKELRVRVSLSNKRFCSQECADKSGFRLEASKKGAATIIQDSKDRAKAVRAVAKRFISENPQIVIDCHLNRITSTLKELWDEIESQTDVKDFRTISKALIGKDGRKPMLIAMKRHAQNIVRTNENTNR